MKKKAWSSRIQELRKFKRRLRQQVIQKTGANKSTKHQDKGYERTEQRFREIEDSLRTTENAMSAWAGTLRAFSAASKTLAEELAKHAIILSGEEDDEGDMGKDAENIENDQSTRCIKVMESMMALSEEILIPVQRVFAQTVLGPTLQSLEDLPRIHRSIDRRKRKVLDVNHYKAKVSKLEQEGQSTSSNAVTNSKRELKLVEKRSRLLEAENDLAEITASIMEDIEDFKFYRQLQLEQELGGVVACQRHLYSRCFDQIDDTCLLAPQSACVAVDLSTGTSLARERSRKARVEHLALSPRSHHGSHVHHPNSKATNQEKSNFTVFSPRSPRNLETERQTPKATHSETTDREKFQSESANHKESTACDMTKKNLDIQSESEGVSNAAEVFSVHSSVSSSLGSEEYAGEFESSFERDTASLDTGAHLHSTVEEKDAEEPVTTHHHYGYDKSPVSPTEAADSAIFNNFNQAMQLSIMPSAIAGNRSLRSASDPQARSKEIWGTDTLLVNAATSPASRNVTRVQVVSSDEEDEVPVLRNRIATCHPIKRPASSPRCSHHSLSTSHAASNDLSSASTAQSNQRGAVASKTGGRFTTFARKAKRSVTHRKTNRNVVSDDTCE